MRYAGDELPPFFCLLPDRLVSPVGGGLENGDVVGEAEQVSFLLTPNRGEFLRSVDNAIAKTQAYFLREQHPEGYWYYPLEANATMDAEYIFFNHFVGRVDEQKHQRICDHLLAVQNEEGAWPLFYKGPSHLGNTIEAYFALKLTGYQETHPVLVKARSFILERGGLAQA